MSKKILIIFWGHPLFDGRAMNMINQLITQKYEVCVLGVGLKSEKINYKNSRIKIIDNKGEVINAEDFRLKDTKVFNIIDKIKDKFRRSVNIKTYNLLKKIYPIFKYLVFKLKNRKNKKFFK